jgi:hypothetical protein
MTAAIGQLTTGWEPDVAVGDTIVRRYLFHFASLCDAFAKAGGGRTMKSSTLRASDLGRPAGYWNAATLLQPPSDWRTTLDEVDAFFAGGTGEAMLWSAWPTPDLRERGWRLSGHPPLLIRPPATQVGLPSIADPDVRTVRTAAELARWERTVIEAYPIPRLAGALPGALAAPALLDDDRLRFLTAHLEGHAVSAAVSFVEHGVGSLAFGATVPAARRRGLWQQLAVARIRTMPQLWVAGVFSDFSRPGGERLGFVPVQRFTLWVRDRGPREPERSDNRKESR